MAKKTDGERIMAWHFGSLDGRTNYAPRAAIEAGTVISIGMSAPVLCARGPHGSIRAIDALGYAHGERVSRVALWGSVIDGGDKCVAQNREHLWVADATVVLHEFACWCAERAFDALRKHDIPIDPRLPAAVEAKRRWLRKEITDGELAAARAAALAAARAAALAAARDAARAAALAAARAAARAAAWDAAWDAARAAARAAARDAARAAAWAAARDAAWDAFMAEANTELESRLMALAPAGYAEKAEVTA